MYVVCDDCVTSSRAPYSQSGVVDLGELSEFQIFLKETERKIASRRTSLRGSRRLFLFQKIFGAARLKCRSTRPPVWGRHPRAPRSISFATCDMQRDEDRQAESCPGCGASGRTAVTSSSRRSRPEGARVASGGGRRSTPNVQHSTSQRCHFGWFFHVGLVEYTLPFPLMREIAGCPSNSSTRQPGCPKEMKKES
jgi:hypothetical protein